LQLLIRSWATRLNKKSNEKEGGELEVEWARERHRSLPRGNGEQTVAPVREYIPEEQLVHADEDDDEEKVPAGHITQPAFVTPPEPYLPAGQVAQD